MRYAGKKFKKFFPEGVKKAPAGNIKVDKEKFMEKIDGAIASIMGLDRAIQCGNEKGDPLMILGGF